VNVDKTVTNRLTVELPENLVPADETTPVFGAIQVLAASGYITPGFPVQLER
jgi:hypothetical protein